MPATSVLGLSSAKNVFQLHRSDRDEKITFKTWCEVPCGLPVGIDTRAVSPHQVPPGFLEVRDMYAHNQMTEELIKPRIIEQLDPEHFRSITNSKLEGLLAQLRALREIESDPEYGATLSAAIKLVFLLLLMVETAPAAGKLVMARGAHDRKQFVHRRERAAILGSAGGARGWPGGAGAGFRAGRVLRHARRGESQPRLWRCSKGAR